MKCKKIYKSHFLLALLIIGMFLLGDMEETVAWLQNRDSMVNTFFSPVVDVEIIETFDEAKTKKENVYVKNNSNTEVYVRVKLIAERKVLNDEVEEVVYSEGISSDYEGDFDIDWTDSSNWIYSTDGFFYYTVPIEKGLQTENLIDTCVMAEGVDPLSLHIYAQAIQPSDVEEAWKGVKIENGTLTPTTG